MKNLEQQGRIITCILPKGKAHVVLQGLFDRGITRANFAFARGFDIHDIENPKTGIPDAVEKEVVTLIAKNPVEGEELFNLVYELGSINHLGGGIIHMSKIAMASSYELPKIEQSKAEAHLSAASV